MGLMVTNNIKDSGEGEMVRATQEDSYHYYISIYCI